MVRDLTQGNIKKNMAAFAVPYLFACFLQTFYPIADLFIAGLYNGPETISAISIGGQVMHLVVMAAAGIAMGSNVCIGQAFGEKSPEKQACAIASTIGIFLVLAIILTPTCVICTESLIGLLQTPKEAYELTVDYTRICFIGIPFIAAYNVISSIYRGFGDTRHPLIFVAIGGVFNIILDVIFIGYMEMGAVGAAAATVIAQVLSVVSGLVCLRKIREARPSRAAKAMVRSILNVGLPILCQDGVVQIGFLIITAIANSRGLYVSAAVGIVEKIICFFFLVPSAMLATVSAFSAQNRGAGFHQRSKLALRYGIIAVSIYGAISAVLCQPLAPLLVGLFTDEPEVNKLGAQYLRTYSIDILAAGIHFCFSGFFCAYSKSIWSFVHNIISIVLVRVPGTWLVSILFPATLYEMGIVTPAGSLVSVVICIIIYRHYREWWSNPSKLS